MDILRDLIFDYTLRNVALGSAILGIVGGVLGSFAVLRRQGLMGDALSHAALPGLCLAYMLTGSKTPIVLVPGAAARGLPPRAAPRLPDPRRAGPGGGARRMDRDDADPVHRQADAHQQRCRTG